MPYMQTRNRLIANAKAQRPAVAGTLPPLVGLSDGGEA